MMMIVITTTMIIKVAEHSFCMPFCWCNSVHTQGFQKTNMHSIKQSFYLPNTRIVCVIFLYNWMHCIVGFGLLFVCYRNNPVKCNACAVAQKIKTDCFCRNMLISNGPVIRISRNLAKIVQKPHEWSIMKNLKCDLGNF